MMHETPHNISILVVDDRIENLRLLTNLLGEQGYEARPVSNGRQALTAVERDPPDLILLDIHMPEMDGYEVCRQLKKRDELKDIPVIFLTAYTETEGKVRAFDMGGVDYITKPFQFEEVLSRVRTHIELRRARQELAQSYQRLRDLEDLRDSLVHMVIHDMGSPLHVVKAVLELLQTRSAGNIGQDAAQHLRTGLRAAESLNRLIKDLLDIRRLEEGKMPIQPSSCEVAEMARSVGSDLARVDPARSIRVEVKGPLNFECDPAIVRRVLENLVINGIKHTPTGGQLRISIANGAGRLRVEVRDQGPGIPPESREKIFEKFGTLEARKNMTYHSVGLGLAFCKLAVEAHGGTIGVECGETGCSTFWFELPAAS